jgi:hypothetical protein
LHFWRCAESGGQLAHDVGLARLAIATPLNDLLGYSGPNSDSGSFFAPSGTRLQSGEPLASVTSPFSVECWIWPELTPAANAVVMSWDAPASPHCEIVFLTTRVVDFFVNAVDAIGVTARTIQRWHHIVGTYDGATVRTYVDAVLDGSAALAGPVTIAKSIAWGGRTDSGASPFQGFIAECAVYGAALSPARITAHFLACDNAIQDPVWIQQSGNGGLPGASTGVAAPGSGDVVADLSAITNALKTRYSNTP